MEEVPDIYYWDDGKQIKLRLNNHDYYECVIHMTWWKFYKNMAKQRKRIRNELFMGFFFRGELPLEVEQ